MNALKDAKKHAKSKQPVAAAPDDANPFAAAGAAAGAGGGVFEEEEFDDMPLGEAAEFMGEKGSGL